jgi:hypothetical protein
MLGTSVDIVHPQPRQTLRYNIDVVRLERKVPERGKTLVWCPHDSHCSPPGPDAGLRASRSTTKVLIGFVTAQVASGASISILDLELLL